MKSQAITTPARMPLRAFLRGGYQTVDRPTAIYGKGNVHIGTWVPGPITSEFTWSREDPQWLKGAQDG